MFPRALAMVFLGVSMLAASIETLPLEGLRNPYGVALGPDGALYICDIDNHVIWRAKDGAAQIVAGTMGKRGFSGDGGPATREELNEPYEIRFDSSGSLFFVEMRNHLVRKVAKDGTISTIAGLGRPGFAGDGGPASRAQFNQPHSIQFDASDNLYLCDIGNHRIRRIDGKTGVVTTFAGN